MKNNQSFLTRTLFLITLTASIISVILFFHQSIRLDEAQSIWTSSKSLPSLLKLTAEDVNLPMYGVILHYWLQFWGTNIIYARALSLIFFVLSLPIIYQMAKESSNEKQALLTTILFSFSPFIIWYTSEARTYTLFLLITCLNHLFFLRMFRSKGERSKTGFFLSALMGIYTHYFFLFLLAAQAIFVLFWFLISRKLKLRKISSKKLEFTLIYFLLLFSAIFLFLPWGAYVLKQGGAANTQPLIPPPSSYNLIQSFVNFTFGFQSQQIQTILVSLWPLLIIFLFLVFTQRAQIFSKNLEYFSLTLFIPIILVFLISFYRSIFLSRYLIIVIPSLFFLISWLISNQPKKISRFLSIGLILTMLGLVVNQSISTSNSVKENYGDLVDYLNYSLTYKDLVLISPPFTIYPIEYSYQGTAKLTTIPVWDNRYTRGPIPTFSMDKLIDQVNGYKGFYNRLFVILSYDQGYQKDIENYLDSNYERLEEKKFPNEIVLKVYKTKY